MRMLVRQNKYYNNLKNIDTNDCDDSDKEYGYFYDLDINDNAILIEKIQLCENPQNNIINNYYDRYYIYNNHDQKKDDDIIPKDNDDDYNEKYSDLRVSWTCFFFVSLKDYFKSFLYLKTASSTTKRKIRKEKRSSR